MSDDALIDEDFREILVGARRSESGDVGAVGVKIGSKIEVKLADFRSGSQGRRTVRGPTKGSKYFTEVSGKGLLRSAYIALRGLTYTARKESESVEPRQQGEYDTNYGYWRERTCISREEVLIAAPLDTVWSLHTDISSWSEWLPDIDTSTIEGSLRVGTVFHWQTSGLTIESTIRKVDPPRRIV
jgi:Polyketide cyclase / dehydrase and lipid transport